MHHHVIGGHEMQHKFHIGFLCCRFPVFQGEVNAVRGGYRAKGIFSGMIALVAENAVGNINKAEGFDIFLKGFVGVQVKSEVCAAGYIQPHGFQPGAVCNGHPGGGGRGQADQGNEHQQQGSGQELF